MMDDKHYDTLETRDPAQREAQLLAALPAQVAHAQRSAPALARILAGVAADSINSRAALAKLPVTRKHELQELQQAARGSGDPFGGFSTLVRGPAMPRLYASPGPIYEPDTGTRDYWRCARAMFAAGFRSGDLVHNAFSYHMTPGAFIFESGAHALGCSVFPAGTGQTEQQLQAIAELRPDAYMGTPSFLRILVEKGERRQAATSRACARPWSAAKPSRPACATGSPNAGWTCTRPMPRQTSASSPTKPRRAKAWSSTKACCWRSCVPAPATRWPKAKWARWW